MRADSICDSAQAVAPAFSEGKFWVACNERLILWDRYSKEERVVETLFRDGRILSLGGANDDGTIIGHVVFPGTRGALWRFSENEQEPSIDLNLQLISQLGAAKWRRQGLRFDTRGRVAFPTALGARIVNAQSGIHMKGRGTSGVVTAVAWNSEGRGLSIVSNPKQGSRKGAVYNWNLRK